MITIYHFILYGEVFLNEFIHAHFNLFLFLARRFVVEDETDFAFLAFNVRIARALASEHSHHCLVE